MIKKNEEIGEADGEKRMAYCSRNASMYRMASLFISMVTARFSLESAK
jgi:hypothetical protein